MKDTWGGLHSDRLSPCGATECPYQVVIWMYNSIAQETRKAIKHIDKGALQKKHKETVIQREILTIINATAQLTCLFACVLVCIVRSSLYSLYNVCGSLGEEWGLQGDTVVWADRVPGSQSLTGPTGNEKVLLSPLCHFAIPEKTREAWQRRRWRRAAQNGPGTGGSMCHCSYCEERCQDRQAMLKDKNQPKIFPMFIYLYFILIIIRTPWFWLFFIRSDTKEMKDVHYTQDLLTWGLRSNQAGRTHSVVPECCECSSTGLSGCDSILEVGRHGRCTHMAHSRHHQPGRNQSYLDDSAHNGVL